MKKGSSWQVSTQVNATKGTIDTLSLIEPVKQDDKDVKEENRKQGQSTLSFKPVRQALPVKRKEQDAESAASPLKKAKVEKT